MSTIEIGNVREARHGDRDPATLVYVGRRVNAWPESPLGNPYRVGRDGTREECVAKFSAWLNEQLAEAGSPAALELARLRAVWLEHGALVLLCWCAPLSCHAEVIRDRMEAR